MGSSSSWKVNLKIEGIVQPRSVVPSKIEPSTAKVDVPTGAKGKSETSLNVLVMLNVSGVKGTDRAQTLCFGMSIQENNDD